jgi:hypothetical protein
MNRQEVARLRREVERLRSARDRAPSGPLVAVVRHGETPPESALLVFVAPRGS